MQIHTTASLVAAVLAAAAGAQTIITNGTHADIGLGEGSELELHIHLEDLDLEYEPDEAIFRGSFDGPSILRPADAAWNFTGAAAGDALYVFADSPQAGQPFLGLGAEEVDAAAFNGDLTVSFEQVGGPGLMSVYGFDSFGALEVLLAGDTPGAGPAFSVLIGSHSHYNIAFTEFGTYELLVSVSADSVAEGAVSASAVYTFQVVPAPGAAGLLAAGGLLTSRRRR